MNVSNGTSTIAGGSGVNTINATGGWNTLTGGSGANFFNASGGYASMYGGLGPNVYNLSGVGAYNVTGNGYSNQLIVKSSGDCNYLQLSEYNGSQIYITGYNRVYDYTNGYYDYNYRFTWSATNISSVTAYGNQDGGSELWAAGMTQGVNLIGYGWDNYLWGGQGTDTHGRW